ncbi:LacI family DNA-binding transcriptional regulator [Martelella lutilitoris]|uniref:LacI family DNA-binding transcriptional regulator n=1 Tax=Martelella lutilitoris TaxID=2583532 RepID=A0A7T7KNY3_9HYPH|nr:LacI family DNA-binding transcriptional regulator [Martelella lutilitoris]QQM32479.1 LacI family DNA-binding transcriptional regulator [Martelella lutilitoris]
MVEKFVSASDVARLAGVSRSAVSRTFTEGASVAPKTRARVMKAAEELGYRVNLLARTLHKERSDLVGLVGANLSNPYISAQVDALTAALYEYGLQCMLLNLAGARDDVENALAKLLEYRVRTVVLLSGAVPDTLMRLAAANGTRLVLINRPLPENIGLVDQIEADSAAGGALAAQRLIAAGCRNVAVVVSESRTSAKLARAEAFIAVMEANRVPVSQWSQGRNNYETGIEAARSLLAKPGIDGIFGVTDEIALGVMNTARHELGLSVPGDVSVIGFDDAPISDWSSHRLTTVRQSLSSLTSATLKAITGPARAPSSHHFIPVSLVERQSVRPARSAVQD